MNRDAFVVGGLILLAMLKKTSDGIAWGNGWHWPVPDLIMTDLNQRYPATISQEFKPGASFAGGAHPGVDIMYRRRSITDRAAQFPAGVKDAGGAAATTMFFAPQHVPILAARDARVWAVQPTAIGWMVVLDHGAPWATAYHHLDTVTLDRHANGRRIAGSTNEPQLVKAGEQIGTMGHNPNTDPAHGVVDGSKVRHLHFEAWFKGNDWRSGQDPSAVMQSWGRSTWTL